MRGIKGKVYLVGGAVRDQLLELPCHERDWVVVGSTPEEMLAAGFRQADPEFPVFLHPQTGEEYALARRERKIGAGYRGFAVDASPGITLHEDLQRRDLTINAIARDEDGQLIDPFDGQGDLVAGRLRHISPAFAEDPLRLLRLARFAAKLGGLGFRLAHSTHKLIKQMVADGAVAELLPQRIGREMNKALTCEQPWRFFEVLNACNALQILVPGLAQQLSGVGHGDSQTGQPIKALQRACVSSEDPAVRFAALFLSTADEAKRIGEQLVPGNQAIGLLTAARDSMQVVNNDFRAETLFTLLQRQRAWQRGGRFEQVLEVIAAQPGGRRTEECLRAAREAGMAIGSEQLMAKGFKGAELGQAIAQARVAAIARVIEQQPGNVTAQ